MLVTCLLMGVMGPCLSDDVDAKYQQIVTDGLGNELELDRVPSKIVTIGAGFTATAIDMGLLDKIIVADKYSYSNADKVFDGLREKRLAVVIVSHDMAMVARYCDRIVMLRDHRIHALGTPEEVMTPENMKAVFNVDAELIFDEKIGKHTVLLHDSYNVI